jgi:hypothetical protein
MFKKQGFGQRFVDETPPVNDEGLNSLQTLQTDVACIYVERVK